MRHRRMRPQWTRPGIAETARIVVVTISDQVVPMVNPVRQAVIVDAVPTAGIK
jgi:hypothetical protein